MKIVAISDLHGFLPEIPPCDLLLIAGDICPVKNHAIDYQAAWLDGDFRRWLESLTQVRQIIGVAGNHDFIFERAVHQIPRGLPWIYLQDQLTEYEGLKIWGTPWQTWFFDWAFNGQPEELKAKWALIPNPVDIIVVHGPPRGYGDGVPEDGGVRLTGCPHLLERIAEIQPELVVFGHIHQGRGQWQLTEKTTLANVAILDETYKPAHKPWIYETRPRGG